MGIQVRLTRADENDMSPSNRTIRSRGMSLIYGVALMVVLCGFASFAIDFGRVEMVRTELQRAADGAARYGAANLYNVLYGVSAATNTAIASAKENNVNGKPCVLNASDVVIGKWNSTKHKFTASSDLTKANAVQVTTRATVALPFATVVGKSSIELSATSVVYVVPGNQQTYSVPATSNPFLAGMPNGSVASVNNPHANPDYAGSHYYPKTKKTVNASPIAASNFTLTSGQTLTFDGINGNATNDYNDSNTYTADGNTGSIQSNSAGSENGIANCTAPLNCLVGVFLTDAQPSNSSAPASLNFSTASSRDFATLSPKVKQLFFVGDGRTSNGDVQQFVVPEGATRLFVGTWDGYEWNNNAGAFTYVLHAPGTVSLVK